MTCNSAMRLPRVFGRLLIAGLYLGGWGGAVCLGTEPGSDTRIRTVVYGADEVYRLRGYVGYQTDLEFEPGESFVGLGAGDVESLTFGAQGNHLFLKPRAGGVATNLTIITTRRTYHFDYQAGEHRPDGALGDVVYVMRFAYAPAVPAVAAAAALDQSFVQAEAVRPRNLRYAYRGSPGLKPTSAWDDGAQTHLVFGSRQEMPAIFVSNEDGTESLVNFSIDADEVTVHRVARELHVRRGSLAGCIVNEDFAGEGERLRSGTVAPQVQREVRRVAP
jgi:type IV secretion system protein VirB9